MTSTEPGDSGARMIDGATMERIRTISAVARQLSGVAEQLTRVRDALMTGAGDPARDEAVLRGSVEVLIACALSLREVGGAERARTDLAHILYGSRACVSVSSTSADLAGKRAHRTSPTRQSSATGTRADARAGTDA